MVQAVVNEDTTADALLLQKENERLRKELDMFRQVQQVNHAAITITAQCQLLLLHGCLCRRPQSHSSCGECCCMCIAQIDFA